MVGAVKFWKQPNHWDCVEWCMRPDNQGHAGTPVGRLREESHLHVLYILLLSWQKLRIYVKLVDIFVENTFSFQSYYRIRHQPLNLEFIRLQNSISLGEKLYCSNSLLCMIYLQAGGGLSSKLSCQVRIDNCIWHQCSPSRLHLIPIMSANWNDASTHPFAHG